ncbi:MAG: SusC/RagA family TonB-linked outer membrane protein [Chitinophaga sp.]|nr:SusC/RagA family TonB-linked outer membrane protein [Chitinophaga sp.]
MRKVVCLGKNMVLTIFLFLSQTLLAQDKTVSGTIVSDDDGTPLLGVTVTNKSTGKKTTTNAVGYYTIAAQKGQLLVFSYVGFTAKEVNVGDDDKVSVRLVDSDKNLTDVVVTAYDIKKSKRELTYQALTVNGDDIASTRRENFINSLAGRIPGATITATTGMPGASSTIVLRGPTSIDGSNQPLFVVDGLIIDNSSFEMQDRLPASGGLNFANRSNDFGNRAMDINPEDIDVVTVLKGPEATALYGSDGANGAIIITTKKGKKGKASVSYNNSFRFEKVYRLPEIQKEFDQGFGGITNNTQRTFFGNRLPEGAPVFDNLGSFFRTGNTAQHNLAVEGGSDVSTYRFTASVVNQNGVVPNTGFERYNFRLNTTFKLSPKFNITNSFSYISSKTTKASKGSGGFLLSLLTWPVDDDARNFLDANGNRRSINGNFLQLAEDDNPFWDVNRNQNFDNNNRLMGNFQLSYDPYKWLNLTALMGVDFYADLGTWFTHPQSNLARTVGGSILQFRAQQTLVNGAYRATVRKKIGNFNNVITAAFTFDSRKYEVNGTRGERLFDQNFVSLNNADPTTVASITTAEDNNRMGAFINYNGSYKNLVNFSLAGRMDGSSRLVDPTNWDPAKPYYFYWSAGSSVILSDIFTLPKQISYLKYRINYATTGRDPRTPYVTSNRFAQSTFTGGGFSPFVTQGNPNLKAEFSQQFETGIEAKFFKGRIGIDLTYYSNKTVDQLLNPRLSYASGAILKWINGGDVVNRGIELQILASPIKTKKFTWDVTVNWARNRNEILRMPSDLPFFYNSDTWIAGIRNIATKGGSMFDLAATRFQRNTAGDVLISPTSGLPVRISDYIKVADRQPDWNMGFLNSFTFLNDWNISFNLDIRKGGDIFNGTEFFLYSRGASVRTLDRETPRVIRGVLQDGLENTAKPTRNTIVLTPFTRSEFYTLGVAEEDFIERDINWIRMRDITVTYKLPSKLIKRQNIIKSASVFFTGTDLFIITNYRGADPAANANNAASRGGIGGVGMDFGNLATPMGLNFGIRAQF